MNVRFMAASDLEKVRYDVDTYAFCGKLISVEEDCALILTLDDGETFKVKIGEYNPGLKEKTKKIISPGKYLLTYSAPYEKGASFVEANQENSIVAVSEETYDRFHELRRKAREYLSERLREEAAPPEREDAVPDDEILSFIRESDQGEGVKLDLILERFAPQGDVYSQVLELLEKGELYEPRAGTIKPLG